MSGQWLRSWRGCAGAWRADKGPRPVPPMIHATTCRLLAVLLVLLALDAAAHPGERRPPCAA